MEKENKDRSFKKVENNSEKEEMNLKMQDRQMSRASLADL